MPHLSGMLLTLIAGVHLLATTVVQSNSAQQADYYRPCVIHQTCGRCLAANDADQPPSCGWCIDPLYDDTRRPRCVSLVGVPSTVTGGAGACAQIYVPSPRDALLDDRETCDFGDFGGGVNNNNDAVQIRPQRVRIALKRAETKTIRLTYRPARNYPLDLYYLMDMTHSMEDDKETLSTVANDLAASLQLLTAGNFRIGFGTFVDKPAMPFIATAPRARRNPCAMAGGTCQPTYGFRNHRRLDRNVTGFVASVAAAAMSANLDNLEGGLEALMQAVVCTDAIGWLRQSRKIVVFATDGGMHIAGDGLLAGVVRPNDGRCHLTATGEYEAALRMDYPSLEQLVHELRSRKVSVIFAATAAVRDLYERVRALMPEVSGVGELKGDSSNVMQLVGDGYAEFVRRVRFYDNAAETGVLSVRYEAKCGDDRWVEGDGCDDVRVGGVYEFRVHVTRLDDGGERDEMAGETTRPVHTIRVEESSISSENLQVEVELVDECPCLQEPVAQLFSGASSAAAAAAAAMCNGHGVFRCGMCLCEAGWLGKRCDCDGTNYGGSREVEHRCRVPSTAASDGSVQAGAICSDRGECSCGQCNCNRGFTGPHCECEQCPYYRGFECGGAERATCDCGTCRCRPGWSGERCDCTMATGSCMAPGSMITTTSNNDTDVGTGGEASQLCSGRGRCECGQCRCADTFYGAFCESSTTHGSNELCSFYEPCVTCLVRAEDAARNGDSANAVCAARDRLCATADGVAFRVQWVQSISVAGDSADGDGYKMPQTQSAAVCVLRLMVGGDGGDGGGGHLCEHRFGYRVAYGDGAQHQQLVSSLRIVQQECGEPLGAGVVGASIVVATFLIGFAALMAVKLVQMVQDRREFARFEADVRNAPVVEFTSPLYRSPTRVYEVPAQVRNSAGGGGINDFEMNDI